MDGIRKWVFSGTWVRVWLTVVVFANGAAAVAVAIGGLRWFAVGSGFGLALAYTLLTSRRA